MTFVSVDCPTQGSAYGGQWWTGNGGQWWAGNGRHPVGTRQSPVLASTLDSNQARPPSTRKVSSDKIFDIF